MTAKAETKAPLWDVMAVNAQTGERRRIASGKTDFDVVAALAGAPRRLAGEFLTVVPHFKMYIVRMEAHGLAFNYMVADEVAQSWYNAPWLKRITDEEALSLPFTCDRTAPIGWREMELMRDRIILPGSKVVECGCHQGLTTVMAAAWAGPEGLVHAFDAVAINVLVARRNLELNAVTNAVVCCTAIGGKRGLVNLFNGSNSVAVQEDWVNPDSAVMVRLEDVVTFKPDVLKLDIEGAELDVLEASQELVATIPRLAIEVHTDMLPKNSMARIVSALPGRRLQVLWGDGRSEEYSGQPIGERVHLFAF
jgi:FkbM family methyltransferase